MIKGKAMASRNVAVNTEHDDDDLPDQLTDGDVPSNVTSNAVNNGGTSFIAGAGMSLDELNAQGFDDERDELERRKLIPPTGDWVKNDRWQYEKVVNEADCLPGDRDSAGRTFYRVFGKPEPRQENGIEHDRTLSYRFSPDRRPNLYKPGEPDLAYKLFLKAKDLHLAIHQEKPRTFGQLIDTCTEDNYLVRTTNYGDTVAKVVDIKVVDKKR